MSQHFSFSTHHPQPVEKPPPVKNAPAPKCAETNSQNTPIKPQNHTTKPQNLTTTTKPENAATINKSSANPTNDRKSNTIVHLPDRSKKWPQTNENPRKDGIIVPPGGPALWNDETITPSPTTTPSQSSSETKKTGGSKKRKGPEPKEALGVVKLWSEESVEALEKEAAVELAKQGRKKARRAKKREKAAEAADELESRTADAEVIIALDMSTSPGLCIVDRSDTKLGIRYELVGFAQTDKQQSMFDLISARNKTPGRIVSRLKNGDSATLRVWRAPKEGKYANNTEYYDIITSKLIECMIPHAKKRCCAIVEAYAFHIHSSSVTPLAELGGVIRNKLLQTKIPFLEVSPTSIKKWFTGSGSADKPQMWKKFNEIAPAIKLDEWLPAAFSESKIPSPHQDIVDAFASAHSLHSNFHL